MAFVGGKWPWAPFWWFCAAFCFARIVWKPRGRSLSQHCTRLFQGHSRSMQHKLAEVQKLIYARHEKGFSWLWLLTAVIFFTNWFSEHPFIGCLTDILRCITSSQICIKKFHSFWASWCGCPLPAFQWNSAQSFVKLMLGGKWLAILHCLPYLWRQRVACFVNRDTWWMKESVSVSSFVAFVSSSHSQVLNLHRLLSWPGSYNFSLTFCSK